MTSTWIDLAEGLLGVLAFAVFILPPGYLAGYLADVHAFRSRSRAEQLLWSLVLGLPLATLFSVSLVRQFPSSVVNVLFLAALASASYLYVRAGSSRAAFSEASVPPRAGIVIAVCMAAYPLLALVDVQIGHRLFISTVMSDWAMRVPIVDAAVRSGLPLTNPLSALQGHAPPLHYYYFWYVFCAQVARFAHITGRAALTASCVWAGYGLLATIFLSLKYLLGLREYLRAQCLVALAILPVMGLDILIVTMRLLVHREHPDFEIEWWRDDRTPSFISTILYAPHHIAGIVFSLAAFLVLVSLLGQKPSLSRCFGYACLVGGCFAATTGTSTYIAFIFVIVCVLWTVDLVRTREWRLIGILAVCGLVALGLSYSYLVELLTTTSGNQVHGAGAHEATHFAVLRLRNLAFADKLIARRAAHVHGAALSWAFRLGLTSFLTVLELGFFLCVFLHQVWLDFFTGKRLSPPERALWFLFLGASLPALFLSSALISLANDLGMHASIIVRLILLLWATPWVYGLWHSRRTLASVPPVRKLFLAAAALFFVLGLAAQAVQLVFERFYLPMIETGLLNKRTDQMTRDQLSYRLFNIRSAYDALDHTLPQSAMVQFDPAGTMQLGMLLYSNRQIVSSDSGCGTGFGGDHSLCEPIYLRLRGFFGRLDEDPHTSSLPMEDRGTLEDPILARPETATAADFVALCHDLHVGALLIDSKDPEWDKKDSWVWTEPAAFSSPTARAYICPGVDSRATP